MGKFILLIHSEVFHQSNKSEITIVWMNSCQDRISTQKQILVIWGIFMFRSPLLLFYLEIRNFVKR